MNNKDAKNANQAYMLFVKLEGKEMLGKKIFNFWILVSIFVLTLISVSFSKAGLDYLRYKMEDPFINWVDITRQGNFELLCKDLQKTEYKQNFLYSSFDKSQNMLYLFRSTSGKDIRFEGRTVEPSSSLLSKILATENVIQNKGKIYSSEYGVIITSDMASKLGYTSENAAYINMAYPLDVNSANQVGLQSQTNDGYYRVSLPVIAIVKQLPDMMSFMTTPFFFEQRRSIDDPFDISKPEYNDRLTFYCPLSSNSIEKDVQKELETLFASSNPTIKSTNNTQSWQSGNIIEITFNTPIDAKLMNSVASNLVQKFNSDDIVRVYDYNFKTNTENINPDYISVYFNSLDSIRAFQQFVKDNYEVKIDMSQIDSKENFNFVNNMGITLSLGFIVLSCIFIFAFIFYLLRTHFLKIKRNLGTFKAFGVSNKELTNIYLTIMLLLTSSAFIIAFITTLSIQTTLNLFNCEIDANFAYLNVISVWSVCIFALAILTSIIATWAVTYTLLNATPGDLIYDRDN